MSAAVAAAHPIEGAHSIWEIVLHVGQWAEIVAERLAGRAPRVTRERNFPPVGEETEPSWQAAVERTKQLYHALAEDVDGLDASTLWRITGTARPDPRLRSRARSSTAPTMRGRSCSCAHRAVPTDEDLHRHHTEILEEADALR